MTDVAHLSSTTMPAAVLHGRRDLRIENIPRPAGPATDEILIEIRAVGLCGTDLAEWAGGPRQVPMYESHPQTGHSGPTVLGHEFSGVVVETGLDVPAGWVGELVACAGAVPCGSCPACRAGATSQCATYWVIGLHCDGALTRLVRAPVRSCARVGDTGLTAEEAALAQPMAIAVHAARRGAPIDGQRAIVLGAGGIGACLVYVLTCWGFSVTAVDVDENRLRVAAELGARTVIRAGDLDAHELVRRHGEPPTLIYEATGVPAAIDLALQAAAKGARIVCVGMQKEPVAVDLMQLASREQHLIGTNSTVPQTDLPEALRLLSLKAGTWDVLAPWVIPLSQVVAGFEGLSDGHGGAIKVLVDPTASRARPMYPTRVHNAH